MMTIIPTTAQARQLEQAGCIFNFALQGALAGFTLAAHVQRNTISLLHCWQGSPRMVREERVAEEELALLLSVLRDLPGTDPRERGIGSQLDDRPPGQRFSEAPPCFDGLRRKLEALSCRLVYGDGVMLLPLGDFDPTDPEEGDELLPCTADGVAPRGTLWVANQRLCTLAVLQAGPGGEVCMEREDQLSTRQMAILLTVLDHQGVLLSEVWREYLQADMLYGEQWMEREGRWDGRLDERFAGLSEAERSCFERSMWLEFEQVLPLCRELGFSIRRETSYFLHPLEQERA
jgi:hypothetical protein